jgi:hypothetical protein
LVVTLGVPQFFVTAFRLSAAPGWLPHASLYSLRGLGQFRASLPKHCSVSLGRAPPHSLPRFKPPFGASGAVFGVGQFFASPVSVIMTDPSR